MKERLTELITKSDILCDTCGENSPSYCAEALADYLLANGVFVPPCKVGDKIYWLLKDREDYFVSENTITEIGTKGFFVSAFLNNTEDISNFEPWESLGKTAFRTPEEAQQALERLTNYGTDT